MEAFVRAVITSLSDILLFERIIKPFDAGICFADIQIILYFQGFSMSI